MFLRNWNIAYEDAKTNLATITFDTAYFKGINIIFQHWLCISWKMRKSSVNYQLLSLKDYRQLTSAQGICQLSFDTYLATLQVHGGG